ncbi:IS3 family transposase, partial [Pectinatus frisingensis]|uniref:IS3 family transposase n=1 Tax=Pectinatus frisingensis TaxID=865 RepID=UPI0018C509BD
MLHFLSVSRSGYRCFVNHKVSANEQRRNRIEKEITTIYSQSKQIYGAPKITEKLRQNGEIIASRTVGKYMKSLGL